MTAKIEILLLAFIASHIFVVVGGVIAAEKIRKAEAICPSGTIIKGRVAVVLPDCQKILQ